MLGLENVARKWQSAPKSERYDALAAHFNTITKDHEESEGEISKEELQDRLRVRLYPVDYFPEGMGKGAVTQEFSRQSMKVLMLDSENSTSSLQRTELDEYGWAEAEVWAIALQRTFEKEHFIVEREEVKGAPPLNFITGSIYCTTALLELAPYLLPVPENPIIITIPSRNVLIWQEVPPDQFRQLMPVLGKLTVGIYETDEGPITPEYFEWKDGEVKCLGTFARS
jgi:hypothetical protein